MGEPPKTGRMNGESKDGPERSSRGAGWVWLCWVGAILLLYVLSTGPAMRMEQKEHAFMPYGSRAYRAFYTYYWGPVHWVSENTPLQKPLIMYWHLWAPDRFDNRRNGK
jgi:hypothetical protein